MRKIQINIVGVVSSKEEVNEIENVVKVFYIEERVIDLTAHPGTSDFIGRSYLNPSKKQKIIRNFIDKSLQFLTVRGLN